MTVCLRPVQVCFVWLRLMPLPLPLLLTTGLPEEREGQRPPVSHRGVSPQGQCLTAY